jgi:HSP20 family protein
MHDSPQPIIIRIRDLRRERSLTQEALADALGISRQSVNALESGRSLPSLPVALQIADFFSVPLQLLFEMQQEQAKQMPVPVPVSAIQQLQAGRSPQPNSNPMTHIVPLSPLREMREMLDELMDANWSSPVPAMAGPAVNVAHTDTDVLVEMRLPGFHKDDLSIEIGEDFLTITAEHTQETTSNKQYFRREFATQGFTRTMTLPAPVIAEKAQAEMKHGILHLTLPKHLEEKPKTHRVEIKAE